MQQIDAQSFKSRLQSGEPLNVLDVREEIEYHTYNIGGRNIPLSKLLKNLASCILTKPTKLLLYAKPACAAKRRKQF